MVRKKYLKNSSGVRDKSIINQQSNSWWIPQRIKKTQNKVL
ncbi:hypothetical protein [Campylobacter sp.]|nr:hypothetical protein [Campylobacter sp.]